MLKKDKEKVVEELHKVFAEAKGVYLTDYTGVNVEKTNDLRTRFRESNVEYRVVKNTLAQRSLEGGSFGDLLQHLNGPTALAYSFEDSVVPAKIIDKFHKETDLLSIKAGVVEGVVFDKDDVAKIVALPSRDELLAKMLGSLNSPITGLVGVLSGLIRNLVGVLAAVRDKTEKEDGSPVSQAEANTPESGSKESGKEQSGVADVVAANGSENEENSTVDEAANAAEPETVEEVESGEEQGVDGGDAASADDESESREQSD